VRALKNPTSVNKKVPRNSFTVFIHWKIVKKNLKKIASFGKKLYYANAESLEELSLNESSGEKINNQRTSISPVINTPRFDSI